MNCSDKEFGLTFEKNFPVPPPYPVYISATHCRKGSQKSGSLVEGHCCAPNTNQASLDALFDEGYRADVLINTDHGGIIYAHANILGITSPVFRSILKESRGLERCRKQSISIRGVPPEAVHVFIRFLYSSCYEEKRLDEYALHLLVLSHAYVVPRLKHVCERRLEQVLITSENATDIFQLALLCDAPRLSIISHHFILRNFKAVSATEGWKVMKKSHPALEKEILESVIDVNTVSIPVTGVKTFSLLCDLKKENFFQRKKARMRKINEREVYVELYEAMEALVHICRDGCRTIGPHDKVLKENQEPCHFVACKGLEQLLRHFAGCKRRGPGNCIQCKRMWQLLELHSRLCADSNVCKVPLCRNFKHGSRRQNKKDDVKWRILVKKIVRSKSISGAPFFSLESR